VNSIAIVFPGQGSQSVGMLADLSSSFPVVKQVFSEASDVLGYDLWNLTQSGPAEKLDQTIYTQPAILAASFAIWQILVKKNIIKPVVMAGHSLGEYSALVCAGALSFKDAVRLVALRGEYMQEAVPAGDGALAVIVGLNESVIQDICLQVAEQDVLAPANFNSPGQIVIAGNHNATLRAINLAKSLGAKIAKLLPVSVPSHCDLMKPAAARFAEILKEISFDKPLYPIINNVDVKVYQNTTEICDGLLRQLYSPVRWIETVHKFNDYAVNQISECGPGKVLSGLIKRINPELKISSIADLLLEEG